MANRTSYTVRLLALIGVALGGHLTPCVVQGQGLDDPLSLSQVTFWGYQIQALGEAGAVDLLAASYYDLLVLEPTRTDWSSEDRSFDTRGMVDRLKNTPASDGLHRKLIMAYIDIGEAEDWRWYWTWSTDWDCTGDPPADWPDYILVCDPDGWGGNYPVAYWDPDWKDIIIYGQHQDSAPYGDYTSVIDEVIKSGFDGIYLDWVEGFENEDVMAEAQRQGKDPAVEMIRFIEEMRTYAEQRNPGFLIIQQNAAALIDGHPQLISAIDAIAQEAVWYDGDATDDWNDPNGYDYPNEADLVDYYLGFLDDYLAAGLPVFNCEYALALADDAYQRSYEEGFVPYVTRRSLSALTTTPPPGYGVQNAAPIAVDDTVTTSLEASLVIDVLANDSDPDGDALTITDIAALPANGQAVINTADGTITYTPNAGFSGTDGFRYRVSDGRLTAEAAVTVHVVDLSTYYVAPTGSDANPGTEASSWRTIQKAARTLVAGETVYIREGTYTERVAPQRSGSEGDYIVYAAYPGEAVTIDGAGVPLPEWGGLLDISGKSYIKVTGLRVVNAGPHQENAGILVDASSHVILERNYTYNTASSGIGVWDSDNVVIDGNEVELACNDGEQESITVAGTDTFVVKNNHVHHGGPGSNGGEGIDAKDGSSNGLVYNNHVHDMNRLGIYVDAWDKHTHDIAVFQNVVHDCEDSGITVASESGGLLENVFIYNNIAYHNRYCGLEVSDYSDITGARPMRAVRVVNNTFYDNGRGEWGGGICVLNPDVERFVVRNNLVSQNLSFQIAVGAGVPRDALAIDHNLIDGYRGYEDELYGDDYVEGDPLFVSAAGADFHLQVGSPAIDGGSALEAPEDDYEGTLRPQGPRYDIGAYEYVGSNVASAPVVEGSAAVQLEQNHPNPFTPQTTVGYALPQAGVVRLVVYDMLGREVARLVDQWQMAGRHVVRFHAGQRPSGVYYYRLEAGPVTRARAMLLVR